MKEVSGQLVTPQNTLTIPHAAHKPIGSPNTGAKKLPRVAPTKSVGTISPPLNPPPNVMAVNSIFKIKTYHEQLVIIVMLHLGIACFATAAFVIPYFSTSVETSSTFALT